MTDAQQQALEHLTEIDELGRGLDIDEINFVADLIDRDVTDFTTGQMNRIRALHRRTVLHENPDDDDI